MHCLPQLSCPWVVVAQSGRVVRECPAEASRRQLPARRGEANHMLRHDAGLRRRQGGGKRKKRALSAAMIGMARQNRYRTVNLLGEQRAHELVREGGSAVGD